MTSNTLNSNSNNLNIPSSVCNDINITNINNSANYINNTNTHNNQGIVPNNSSKQTIQFQLNNNNNKNNTSNSTGLPQHIKKKTITEREIIDFLYLVEEKFVNNPSKLEKFLELFHSIIKESK